MREKWKYEICDQCGRIQRIAWSVKDSLWQKVVYPDTGKILCLECFLALADKAHIEVRGEDFTFLGWIGENIKGDVIIDEIDEITVEELAEEIVEKTKKFMKNKRKL